jgi:hypothetical protein
LGDIAGAAEERLLFSYFDGFVWDILGDAGGGRHAA